MSDGTARAQKSPAGANSYGSTCVMLSHEHWLRSQIRKNWGAAYVRCSIGRGPRNVSRLVNNWGGPKQLLKLGAVVNDGKSRRSASVAVRTLHSMDRRIDEYALVFPVLWKII